MFSAFFVVLIARGLARIGKQPAAAKPAPRVATDRAVNALSFRNLPRPFIAATMVVAAGVTAVFTVPERPEIAPARTEFIDFPGTLGGLTGTRDTLERVYLDALQLDDYLLMNFRDAGDSPINLYVAYYRSQRSGMSVHSPRLCLPGGGWKVDRFESYSIGMPNGTNLPVNRVLIEKGGTRELVYYWFMERDRRLTSEYVVRWYLFWDALTRNRTDGALVRLVIPIQKGESERAADETLTRFARQVQPTLTRFVPD
jgi:EpsI family protein